MCMYIYIHTHTFKWTTDLNGKPRTTNLLKKLEKPSQLWGKQWFLRNKKSKLCGRKNLKLAPKLHTHCIQPFLSVSGPDLLWEVLLNKGLQIRQEKSEIRSCSRCSLAIHEEVNCHTVEKATWQEMVTASKSWGQLLVDDQQGNRNLRPIIINNWIQSNSTWAWKRTPSSKKQCDPTRTFISVWCGSIQLGFQTQGNNEMINLHCFKPKLVMIC